VCQQQQHTDSMPLALQEIAWKLAAVGDAGKAASAYLRCQEINAAVQCCLALHDFKRAVEIAEDHGLSTVELPLEQCVVVVLPQSASRGACLVSCAARVRARVCTVMTRLSPWCGCAIIDQVVRCVVFSAHLRAGTFRGSSKRASCCRSVLMPLSLENNSALGSCALLYPSRAVILTLTLTLALALTLALSPRP
jgi:hypothetical protein